MALVIDIEGKGIIANCDGISDSAGGTWSEVGGGSIEYAQDAYYCLAGCIGGAYSNKAGRQQYALASALDFDTAGNEEGQFLYIWLQTSTIYLHETIANGGLTVCFGTSAGADFRTFMIAAGDATNEWTGDWKCFVIDPSKAGTVSDSGSFDLGNINYIWVDLDITALAKGNNILIDQIAVGSGIRVTGTSTTPWADIVTYCTDRTSRAWGMVQEREGQIFVYGKIYFGDDGTVSAIQSFVETAAPSINFGISEYYYSSAWELSVPTDYCGIVIEDDSGYITTFDDGVLVGSDNGRSGTTFIGHDELLVSIGLYGGSNSASLTRLYGTIFKNIRGGITWGNDAQHLYYGGNIVQCGQFDPVGGPIIRNCIYAETVDVDSALLWNENINITDCKFIANTAGAAIEMPSAAGTPYSYTRLYFSDNTYDVLNSATALTINKAGIPASDPSSYEGSTVTFSGSVNLSIYVEDEDKVAIENAQTSIYLLDSPFTELMNEDTLATGLAEATYSGSTPIDIVWKVRKSEDTDNPRYFARSGTGQVTSSGFSLSVTLKENTFI